MAYRNRDLGARHVELERYARRLLAEACAAPGSWRQFNAACATDAATVDQCLTYIVRTERPAESVRVDWRRWDGSWRRGFPRPLDRRGHGEVASVAREVRAALGRQAAMFDDAELARMAREQDDDGRWWYVGQLRVRPKRGTVPAPAVPRPRRSMAAVLGDALAGRLRPTYPA